MNVTQSLKKILVVGANGRQGTATIDALLSKGFNVTGLVRDASKGRNLEAKGVSVVVGNLNDINSLNNAFEGVDGLYIYFALTGEAMRNYTKNLNNVMIAAKEKNIKFIVYSNGVLIRPGSEMSVFDNGIILEDNMMKDFACCILKPAGFMDDALKGKGGFPFNIEPAGVLSSAFSIDQKGGLISTDDIGHVAAAVFENPDKYNHRRINIVSDVITGQEALDIVSRVSSTKFVFKFVGMPLFLRMFLPGLVRHLVPDDALLDEALTNVKSIYPNAMTFEQYLMKKEFKNKEADKNSCIIS